MSAPRDVQVWSDQQQRRAVQLPGMRVVHVEDFDTELSLQECRFLRRVEA
jgi:hypothetical protein